MPKVMKNSPQYDAKKEARDLAILIYDFLLEERYTSGAPKTFKRQLDRATDCLERVYRIGFADYALMRAQYTLPQIFLAGSQLLIRVKDRLKAEYHKRRGNAFMTDSNNRSFKSAEIEYSRAIHLNPRNAVYWCNRAASRIRLESYFSAISDCDKALELDGSYAKALVWKGIAHALTDDAKMSVKCHRRALSIEPGNEICVANLDLINRKHNRTAFRVLHSLCNYGRQLARTMVSMANGDHQDIFKWTKKDRNRKDPYLDRNTEEEYRKRQQYLQKFRHGELD